MKTNSIANCNYWYQLCQSNLPKTLQKIYMYYIHIKEATKEWWSGSVGWVAQDEVDRFMWSDVMFRMEYGNITYYAVECLTNEF